MFIDAVLTTLENKFARLYAAAPAMPKKTYDWIVENLWWLVLAFALLNGVGVLFLLFAFIAVAFVGRHDILAVSDIITLGFGLLTSVLLFSAITPLREHRHSGWRLLFVIELLSIVSTVVGFILMIKNPPILNLIASLAIIALELYVLLQIRNGFTSRSSRAKLATIVEPERVAKK